MAGFGNYQGIEDDEEAWEETLKFTEADPPFLKVFDTLEECKAFSVGEEPVRAKFAPIMNPGGAVISLTYVASEKVAPRPEPSARTLPGARTLGSLQAVGGLPRHKRPVPHR